MNLSTLLDVVGLLLLVAGAALGVLLLYGAPAGLGTAGLGVLGVSWLIDLSAQRKGRK